MEGLDMNNILGAEEIDSLFIEESETQEPLKEEEDKKDTETTEVNVDSLFTEKPESVGSEEEEVIEEVEDTQSDKGQGSSPKKHFYSSIAKALKEEGIFPDLDDETADKVVSAEDFRDIIESQIKAGIEEKQRRIDEALSLDIEVSEIKKYENVITYLDSIKEEDIVAESDKGETLRKQLIFQDLLNRGYSKERAEREVNKSFNSGSDIEDAKEALESNKEYFNSAYDGLISTAKEEKEELERTRKKEAEDLKKSILEEDKIFGDIQLDKATRQKIYNTISKPVYKDPSTGSVYTELQKYEKENRTSFLKNVGILFTLTDGFKNIDKLVKGKVKKEVKKGLAELETTLKSTGRSFDGNLKYASGVGYDSESSARSWDLDV